MPVLTQRERAGAVSQKALKDGLISGGLTLIPSYGAVWLAMKRSPQFLKSTNWQSRTALVVMPALFMFGLTSELRVAHETRNVMHDTHNTLKAAEWAEEQHAENLKVKDLTPSERDMQITELYRQSVINSGVRVVQGDRLGLHHQVMNYGQENPVKILALVGIPSIAWIFWGKSGQSNLQFQQKIMHTRVLGQATVLTIMLSLMGFKEYMDRSGKFITEDEAERRVQEMHSMRESLLQRLDDDRRKQAYLQNELKVAHDADVAEGTADKKVKKHHHKKAENLVSA